MGYYTRVLSPRAEYPSFDEIAGALAAAGHDARLEIEEGDGAWTSLYLESNSGVPIAVIERNPVVEGQLGHDEREEFLERLKATEPHDAAKWVAGYLDKLKTIYAFQHLSGASENEGFEALQCVRAQIWSKSGGLLQGDAEGFSNEDGFYVVWQFDESASGSCWMAALQDGAWIGFEMELSDATQRDAFKAGRVPDGVTLAT